MRLLMLLLAGAVCSAQYAGVDTPKFARVRVDLHVGFGASIPDPVVELVEPSTQTALTNLSRVPYGMYALKIRATGFWPYQRELWVDQSDVDVRAQTSPAPTDAVGRASLRGFITSAPKARKLWVKVVPMIGTGGTESQVNMNGSFLLSGLTDGNYVLLVMDGESLVVARTISTFKDDGLRIDLNKLK